MKYRAVFVNMIMMNLDTNRLVLYIDYLLYLHSKGVL